MISSLLPLLFENGAGCRYILPQHSYRRVLCVLALPNFAADSKTT